MPGDIVIYADSVTQRNLRMSRHGWTSGGIVNLGINWVSSGWQDSDIWHPVPGQVQWHRRADLGQQRADRPGHLDPAGGQRGDCSRAVAACAGRS